MQLGLNANDHPNISLNTIKIFAIV